MSRGAANPGPIVWAGSWLILLLVPPPALSGQEVESLPPWTDSCPIQGVSVHAVPLPTLVTKLEDVVGGGSSPFGPHDDRYVELARGGVASALHYRRTRWFRTRWSPEEDWFVLVVIPNRADDPRQDEALGMALEEFLRKHGHRGLTAAASDLIDYDAAEPWAVFYHYEFRDDVRLDRKPVTLQRLKDIELDTRFFDCQGE